MKSKGGVDRKIPAGKGTKNITKQVLVRAAVPAVRLASQKAMEVAGYVVKAENGWVVRVNQDGSKSTISKIGTLSRHIHLALD